MLCFCVENFVSVSSGNSFTGPHDGHQMFSSIDLDKFSVVDLGPLHAFIVDASRYLKSTMRGAPPIDKTLTIKSVRTFNI